jgi:hypothetical protein
VASRPFRAGANIAPMGVLPLLGSLLAAALASAGAPQDEAAELEASGLLAKAEEKVADGQHADAVRLYERIAEKYPGTKVAEVALRRSQPSAYLGKRSLVSSGPPENRVDVVIMGEGFDLQGLNSFDDVAADVPSVFERDRVFGEYYSYLNIIRADVVSEEDNIDAFGREYRTALGGAMSGGEQGQVTVDRIAVHRILQDELPEADGFAIALVRTGTLGTGGGGVAAVAAREFATLIHEFGHAFADLGDEYSTHTGLRGGSARRVNVSDTEDERLVPWAHFLAAEVRGVGVYEGADGKVRGAWKPTSAGCIMGDGEFFCPVCREALILKLYEFVDPIDAVRPVPSDEPVRVRRDGEPVSFEVEVMRPATHRLEVDFWLFDVGAAPPSEPFDPGAAARGERRGRGRLEPIARKPDQSGRNAKDGRYAFKVDPKTLPQGEYVLFARAEDPTELRGEKWPWVLKDDDELLKSERVWRLLVE